MNRYILYVILLSLIYGCANKGKSINTAGEKECFEFNDYFKTHSYFLIFSFDETDVCENCVVQILDRLSYLRNFGIKVFIDGVSCESSRRFPDFESMPIDLNHTIEDLPSVPFICLVDSTFSASRYFVPEIDQPQKLEQYLKDVMSKIRKNITVE